MTEPASALLVRGLADVAATDAAWVGGKAASLGELARAGIRVPRGYAITAAAFEEFMAALDPSGAIRAEVGAADKPSVGGKAAGLGELGRAGIPVPPGYVVLAEAFGQALAERLR